MGKPSSWGPGSFVGIFESVPATDSNEPLTAFFFDPWCLSLPNKVFFTTGGGTVSYTTRHRAKIRKLVGGTPGPSDTAREEGTERTSRSNKLGFFVFFSS